MLLIGGADFYEEYTRARTRINAKLSQRFCTCQMVYGLKSEKHSIAVGTEVPPCILNLLEIVTKVRHAFLIIEGKSHAGSAAVAENQARRGGATLVKAARKLRAIV